MPTINSKTTFVTVNQLISHSYCNSIYHSKTTFVTVNLLIALAGNVLVPIQKQPLLLLIEKISVLSLLNIKNSKTTFVTVNFKAFIVSLKAS